MAFVIAEPCIEVKDGSCVAACPVDCIHAGADQYFINRDQCIDCGACEPVCPVRAIFYEGQVPDKWQEYLDKNDAFFGIKRTKRRAGGGG